MLEMMDHKTNACKNFYQYACGGWLATNAIPATRSMWTIDSVIIRERDQKLRNILENPVETRSLDSSERKVKTMYQTCMDLDDIENEDIGPLKDVINRLGGLALSGKNFPFF